MLVYQDKDNMDIISRIFDVLGVLFKFVIAQMNKDRTKDIIDYLMHELEKNKQNLARQRNVSYESITEIPGFNNSNILESLLKLIEISLQLGLEKTANEGLDCLEFIFNHTSTDKLLSVINPLMGCFIRVSAYKVSAVFRLRILNKMIGLGKLGYRYSIMGNQLIGLSINNLNNVASRLRAFESQDFVDSDDVQRYEELFEVCLEFGRLVNENCGARAMVKRWGKRVIVDPNFRLETLKLFIEQDPTCESIKEALLTKINNKVVEGIDDL